MNGKDVTPTKEKEKYEEVTTNGASSAESGPKPIEEVKDPKKAIYCYTCGQETTRVRFHRAKTSAKATTASQVLAEKYDLCPSCYREGRHAYDGQYLDFVKLEDPNHTNVPDRDAPWTDEEVLLLLEALEVCDDDWDMIAKNVRTRTRDECVLKFLQLEIEDKYLGEADEKSSIMGSLNYGRVPLTNEENPVMSVVSFLAAMSDPTVTAAAAGRSVEAMKKSLQRRYENGTSKEKEPMKTEDSMEVDAASAQPDAPDQAALSTEVDVDGATLPLPTVALASSAARAAGLATHEEREMTRLVSMAINTTLEKFELKIKQFSEMEAVLQAERLELERGQQQLFLDRLAFKRRVTEVQEGLRKMQVTGQIGGSAGGQLLGAALGEERLGFVAVAGRAEEDVKPLGAGDDGFRQFEV